MAVIIFGGHYIWRYRTLNENWLFKKVDIKYSDTQSFDVILNTQKYIWWI